MQKFILSCLLLAFAGGLFAQQDNRNNILFIAVDDLKPLLSNYGHAEMHTPNFDRLAAMGMTFTNAHVQYAVCGPSRASIMTGCYPDRTKVWDLHTDFRESNPALHSMPEYLIGQGYETVGIGKIYHKGSSSEGHDGKSWSMGHTLPKNYNETTGEPFINYQSAENRARYAELTEQAAKDGITKPGKLRKHLLELHKPSTESAPVPDDAYQDGVYNKKAIATLKKLSKLDQPWLLALGYQRPHLPFAAPQKYWDLYDRDKIDLSAIQGPADGTPEIAYHNFGELRSYTDIPQDADFGTPLPEAKQRELIHGYLACISYIDALLGELLDALEASGEADRTNIVLWGDHGFHLGDHTLWCKHSNFEQATRIPFMFAGPGVAKGGTSHAPVELLDAFPTLFDLAGVKPDPQAQGKSLVALLDGKPNTKMETNYAASQYQRGGQKNPTMGYSVRTDRYRYTEWIKGYTTADVYDADRVEGVELYDYTNDPLETKNFADHKDFQVIRQGLHTQLLEQLAKQHQQPDVEKGKSKIKHRGDGAQVPTSRNDRPNVLFIEADDLGYFDLGHTGSRIHETPNIDRLAGRGIRFTQAYTNYPRCTPSRYALWTGTYPVNEDHGHLTGIPEEQNVVNYFNREAYHTLFVGKWHLGHDDNSPRAFGFDDSYAAGHAGGVGQRFYPFNTKKRNGKRHKEQVPDVEKDGKEGDYISDLMTTATMDRLESVAGKQPFFATLSFYAVHTPLEGKPADRKRNEEQIAGVDYGDTPEYIREGEGRRKMRQDQPDYAAMVENVDENVGRLLDWLEEKGIADNTLIVFTSDHGGLSNDGNSRERELATTNLPFRAGKGWLYEGGIRVPLIFSWPGELAARTEEQSIVMGMDLLPTMIELATGRTVAGLDGKSAAAVVRGTDEWSDRTIFWNSDKARPHSTGDSKTSAVRSGDFKLLRFKDEDSRIELYDLSNDIGEETDLSTKMPVKAAELLAELLKWEAEYLVPEKMDKIRRGKKD